MNEQATKHTQGPWEMMPPLGEGNYSVMSSKVNAGGNWHVAEIPNGSHAEAQANAALIAAAPELLEACQSALALINISTEYAGMSTAQELTRAIQAAGGEAPTAAPVGSLTVQAGCGRE